MTPTVDLHDEFSRTLRPGDVGFDTAVTGFQTGRPHRPDLVVAAAAARDVVTAVRHAASHDLPLAVQATGHGRGIALDGGLLITTDRMRGVTVDSTARNARIEAGARGTDVVTAATPHGLAPLSGSSSDVGMVGYLLGGGFGLLARQYGYAIDQVQAVDAVGLDGVAVRLTAPLPSLEGLVVTSVETALVPLTEVWGGSLAFPANPDALLGWADWTTELPDAVTSSIALVPFPDLPAVPGPFRGRHVALVRVAATRDASALVAPLRALRPVLAERLGTLEFSRSHTIYSDPTDPHAYAGDARLLRRIDREALRAVPELTGPASPAPSVVELRHLGGALSRASASVGPAYREADYLLRVVTMLDPVTEADARELHRELFAPFAHSALGRAWTFAYGLTRTG